MAKFITFFCLSVFISCTGVHYHCGKISLPYRSMQLMWHRIMYTACYSLVKLNKLGRLMFINLKPIRCLFAVQYTAGV